jgi:hypothetical protein
MIAAVNKHALTSIGIHPSTPRQLGVNQDGFG